MKKPDGFAASAAKYTAIAMTLPATVFGGYFLGYALDTWLGTTWLRILFLVLGIVGGFTQLIFLILRDMKSK